MKQQSKGKKLALFVTLLIFSVGIWQFSKSPNPVLFILLEPYRELRSIPIPLGTQSESLDYPVSDWVLTYRSNARPEQIFEYYLEELPKRGWNIIEYYERGYQKCILTERNGDLRVIEIGSTTHIRFAGHRMVCFFDSAE
jgi:hypothetical protein